VCQAVGAGAMGGRGERAGEMGNGPKKSSLVFVVGSEGCGQQPANRRRLGRKGKRQMVWQGGVGVSTRAHGGIGTHTRKHTDFCG
jgi:hypothetical protein